MNKEVAFKVLKEARDVLTKNNINYFIMGGTLLGFVRDNNFIEHDDDMDLGIFIENWRSDFPQLFEKAGFKWQRQLGTVQFGLEYTFIKEGIQLDIFFWYKEEDYYWYGAWWKKNSPENIIKLKFDKFEIESFDLEEHGKLNAPKDYKHWLEQIYGTDWKISNPDWHWCSSCKNIMQAPFDILKDKTICLGMIVKNESKIIKESLETVKSYIDTWVIVDTGSSDNTIEIIKDILKDVPGVVVERPWVNFGHNRTELASFTQHKADYSLMLDADEIVTIKNLDKKRLIADSYSFMIDDGTFQFYYGVLLNNAQEWKSVGVTHEYWSAPDATVNEVLKYAIINHKCNGENRQDKTDKDIKLLLKGVEIEPKNTRYMFYLAQSYADKKEWSKAIVWYSKRIESGGWWEEVLNSYRRLIECKINQEYPFEEILETMFKGFNMYPQDAEVVYEVLKYCRKKNLNNIGYLLGQLVKKHKMPSERLLFIDKKIYQYGIFDELALFAFYTGRYQESNDLWDYMLRQELPSEVRERIIKNKEFAVAQLKGV